MTNNTLRGGAGGRSGRAAILGGSAARRVLSGAAGAMRPRCARNSASWNWPKLTEVTESTEST